MQEKDVSVSLNVKRCITTTEVEQIETWEFVTAWNEYELVMESQFI